MRAERGVYFVADLQRDVGESGMLPEHGCYVIREPKLGCERQRCNLRQVLFDDGWVKQPIIAEPLDVAKLNFKKVFWPLLTIYAANLHGLGDHLAEVPGEICGTK